MGLYSWRGEQQSLFFSSWRNEGTRDNMGLRLNFAPVGGGWGEAESREWKKEGRRSRSFGLKYCFIKKNLK